MRRSWLLAVVLIAVGALPPSADAKQVTALRVCGATECRYVSDTEKLRVWLEGGFSDVVGAPAGRYYRVALGWGDRGKTLRTTTTVWLPAAHLIRNWGAAGGWWRLSNAQNTLLRLASDGIVPAGRMERVAALSNGGGGGGGQTALYAGVGLFALVGALAVLVAVRRRTLNGRRER